MAEDNHFKEGRDLDTPPSAHSGTLSPLMVRLCCNKTPPSLTILSVGVSTSEAGHDQLRRSHSDQDLLTRQRQQQLARAAEFYTAVGPDGEIHNKIIDQLNM